MTAPVLTEYRDVACSRITHRLMVNIQTEGFPDGPGPAPPPPTPLTLIHDISQHLRYCVQDKLKQNY